MCFSLIAFLWFTGEHSRLLSEPDPGVEVSVTNAGGQVDWTLLQSAVSGKTCPVSVTASSLLLSQDCVGVRRPHLIDMSPPVRAGQLTPLRFCVLTSC